MVYSGIPTQFWTGWTELRKVGARLEGRTGRAELIIRRLLLAKVRDLLWEDSGAMAVLDATPMGHCHGKLCSL